LDDNIKYNVVVLSVVELIDTTVISADAQVLSVHVDSLFEKNNELVSLLFIYVFFFKKIPRVLLSKAI
jgi:hypothetical protein